MLRKPRDPAAAPALRRAVRDGVAFSIMSGSGEVYFTAYALLLAATTAQIAFLAAVPPLLGSLTQLLSAYIGRRLGRRRPLILAGAGTQALVWIPLLLLPQWLPELAVPLMIACVVLYHAAANLASPQWASLMGDLVPERFRGRYFARRTRLMSLTSFLALTLAGGVLHLAQGRGLALYGFFIIFGVALLARAYSLFQLTRIHDPAPNHAAPPPLITADLVTRLRRSVFARFSLFFALMNLAVNISGPFFTVYMLRDLELSYLAFTAVTATSVVTQFLTLNTWGRISDRFGNRAILMLTGFTLPFLAPLWALSTEVWYFIGLQVLVGLTWAGFSLAAGNFIYDHVPGPKRTAYLALHNVLAGIGLFIGALLGGALSEVLPASITLGGWVIGWPSSLCWLFLISGAARLAASLALLPSLKEARRVPPVSAGALIFRVTQMHAAAGMVFSILNLGQRRPAPAEPVSATTHTHPPRS